ncbi:protein TESPA1 isoform X2 [Dermochelys coriacea]|uniref:protein TESPA1 isoform X2 n=1 Tax=Dermochelys coriacea TaxID=27794 RepID=UPI0018E7DCFA|nr:protein TESPA1 isoform X2 [Dermochelys coriacea]
MEAASVLSPSSWEKRRAWVRQSRCWRTTVLEEEAAVAVQDVSGLQPPHLDDVFFEGSPSSKIETWLQNCGASMEVLPEEPGLPAPYGCSSNGTSFEDDLTLGAEALLLPGNDKAAGRTLLEKPWPGRYPHLGQSMASSAISGGTNKTTSSVSEILERCQEDAEEILYNLGFVQDEPQATARIPARFFSAPSQAKGIDFQLFLKAQVQRLEMEDPCLTLASRFQQVEALAATADAFFCLYSYVSKTPLQKISPAQIFWACPEIPNFCVVPAKAEVKSPVDRLKKAISKMCLYMSPRAESPRRAVPSRRRSILGRVVQEVLERAREERFRFDQIDIEDMEGVPREMPTGTFQCQHRVESSFQEPLSPDLAGHVSGHLCHGGEAAPTPLGGKGELHTVPALPRLQWAPQGLPAGTVGVCAEGVGSPGHQEKKGPGKAPVDMVPSKWEFSMDASCPSGGAGSDEESSYVGGTAAPSPGTHFMATKALGTVGTTWFRPEPREGLRSEAGFALDLSRALSTDNAGSCVAWLPHPGGSPGKDGLEAYREALMCPEELRPKGKGHSPHRGSSYACGSQNVTHPQEQDTKAPGPALHSLGEVPASWVAGRGSMLHGPCWAPTLPLQEDDSFEMEEVQSTSEDEDGTPKAAGWLPAPALTRHRRRFILHAHSAHSDSSGFVEEPAPNSTPTTQLCDTACSELGRPMGGPCGTGQAV